MERIPGASRFSALFAVVAAWALAHGPMLASGLARVPGDPGDARLVQLILEHGFRTLAAPGFWDLPMFFPETGVTAWSEVLLGAAPLYWLPRALGAGVPTAYALWLLAVTALNALAMHRVLWRLLGVSPLAAAAGAVLFAAGSPVIDQLGHPQLLARFFVPFAVLCGARALKASGRLQLAWGAGAGALFGLQVLAGYYVGWSAAFIALVALAVAFATARAEVFAALESSWRGAAAFAAAALLVAGPVALRWQAVAAQSGQRGWDELLGLLPRAQSWLYQGPDAVLWGWTSSSDVFTQLPFDGEHRLGFGFLTSAVMVAVLWKERARPWARTVGLTAVAVVLLSTLYRGGFTPWRAVFALVPGAQAIRAVARVGLWMLVPASLSLAWAVDALKARFGVVVAAALFAACAAEQWTRPTWVHLPSMHESAQAVAARIPTGCRAFFLRWNSNQPSYAAQVEAGWAAELSGVPTVNGLSGHTPAGWNFETAAGPDASAAQVLLALETWMQRHGQGADGLCVLPPAR